MKIISRILALIASLVLLAAYFFPLWHIGIWAPQYPEGLNMYIWLSTITGDVTTINILNHYIGMQKILPNSIPELSFFPYIVGVLLGVGVLASVWGRRMLLYVWGLSMLGFGTLAFLDFWKWGYDYGNNLSPDAAIKMEGMTYSPPLIGTKTLLNIYASSWPDLGGYALAVAIFLAAGLVIYEWKRKKIGDEN